MSFIWKSQLGLEEADNKTKSSDEGSHRFLILILVTATPAGELDQSDDATPVTKQGKFHITSAANHISDWVKSTSSLRSTKWKHEVFYILLK